MWSFSIKFGGLKFKNMLHFHQTLSSAQKLSSLDGPKTLVKASKVILAINNLFFSSHSAKILLSNFDAFKFPTSEVVQFRALVTPCMPTCEPVECVYDDFYGSGDKSTVSSYGRRRKRSSGSAAVSRLRRDTGNRVLVTNSFVVMDKFQHKRYVNLQFYL